MEQLAQRQQHGTGEVQRPARAAPRRRMAAKAARGGPARPLLRREEKLGLGALLSTQISQIPPAIYEKIATGGLQSAIVATMVGVTLFFHAPLKAALDSLLH
jgi:hypothetical protein